MTENRPHGLNLDRDPRKDDRKLEGGPPKQQQEWPGLDRNLDPQADHGEESYVGCNKLEGLTALITGGDSGIGRAVAIAFARGRRVDALSAAGRLCCDEGRDPQPHAQLRRDAGA